MGRVCGWTGAAILALALGCGSDDDGETPATGGSGGGSDASANEGPQVIWTAPLQNAAVFGVVQLEAVATDPDGVATISFHVDQPDAQHRIGTPVAVASSTGRTTWFTQDYDNGSRVLYAVATDSLGATSSATRTFELHNPTRSESIPTNATKVTPATDDHPPALEPGFTSEFYDPVPLQGPINTAGGEDSPFVTADGQDFYFWFTPVVTADLESQQTDGVTGIWRARRDGEGWTEPERVYLSYYDEPVLDGAHTILGDEMWFASARAGGVRPLDYWIAHRAGEHWVGWENAGELLNGQYEIGELHFAEDGNALYFDSGRAGGQGEKDIWVTHREGSSWSAPEPIVAVNTSASEGWPYVSADGLELWFTRLNVAPEVWMSRNEGGVWQAPQKVLGSLAGEPTFDPEGNLYFTHHYWSDAQNAMIEADIYVCKRRPTS